MKKKLSLLLALLIVLTSISFTGVKAEGSKFVLSYEGGGEIERFDDSYHLLLYLQERLEEGKSYVLDLYDDLKFERRDSVAIKSNLRIEGHNHKVSLNSEVDEKEAITIIKGDCVFNDLYIDGFHEEIKYPEPEPEPYPYPDPYPLPFPNDPYYSSQNLGLPRDTGYEDGLERIKKNSSTFVKLDGNINNTIEENPSLIMNNCTLTNFGTSAIVSIKSTLELNNCTFKENNVYKSEYNAGNHGYPSCVKASESKVDINKCTFTNNITKYSNLLTFILSSKVKIKGAKFSENEVQTEIIYNSLSTLDIYDSSFIKNKSDYDCSGITASESTVNLKNVDFEENKASWTSAFRFKGEGYKFTIDGCHFKENIAKRNTLEIVYGFGNGFAVGEIKNSEFYKNKGENGAAIYCPSYVNKDIKNFCKLKISNTKFIENKALSYKDIDYPTTEDVTGYGGAIYFNGELTIESSEFINNRADRNGGAIYYRNGEIKEPKFSGAEVAKYFSKLKISGDTIFKDNYAGLGYYNPPKHFDGEENIQGKTNSREGKLMMRHDGKDEYFKSVLNNYDVFFMNDVAYTFYDPNGGRGRVHIIDEGSPLNPPHVPKSSAFNSWLAKRDIHIKSPEEIGISNDAKFLGWNTEPDGSGTPYKPGDVIKNHMGNQWLYAMWQEETKPVPPIILTLDENYKGGKITDKEVMPGDMMEPHLYKPKRRGFTFKGWSYNKKHLDKVHYDDRIYEPTTVYAIWDEVEEEPEEIKGQEHKAYIFGYPDGTVRPNGEITRAEAAAMLARLLEIESIGSADKPMFPDTPSAWYNKAINAVVQRDIMKGYPDGTFKPNDAITRAEFTQMISTIDNKAYGTAPFADVVGHWAERPIGSEYQAGRIMGYPGGTFRPDAHITRCEAAVILNKIFERNFDAMSLLKCKNPQMIKYFIDLDASFWGYNELVEATNTHEYIRRTKGRVEENWLEIK